MSDDEIENGNGKDISPLQSVSCSEAGVGSVGATEKQPSKLSPLIWTIPCALITCYCFLVIMVRTDTPEEESFAQCAGILFLMGAMLTAVGIIRLMLGEGHQQTKTLKRLFFGDTDVSEPLVTPKETLLRASSPPEASSEILLRPAANTTETAPEQLLRASQPKDQ